MMVGNHARQAPMGKFRVLGVDTFEGPFADYLIGDYEREHDAILIAKDSAGTMNPVYVYDDRGTVVWHGGTV